MVRLSRFYSLSKTMNNLLSIEQLTGDEIRDLLALGHRLKAERGHHERLPLKGQTWALIFSKSSTRTRVSFEVGISELGGRPMFLSVHDIQLGRGEPIKDTARVLGRMIHGAAIRTYGQQEVEEFASFSGIPTINALTDEEHPCQILADLLTIEEIYGPGSWKDMKIAFVGDGDNNMSRSWMWAAKRLGFTLAIGAPTNYLPLEDFRRHLDCENVIFTTDPGSRQGSFRHQHGRLAFHGPGIGRTVQGKTLLPLPGEQGAAGTCRLRPLRFPLPARLPRQGNHGRRAGTFCSRYLPGSGKQGACPESRARHACRRPPGITRPAILPNLRAMNYEERLQDLLDELDLFQDWTERYEYIISLGKKLPRLDEAYKTEDSLIKGCQSRVWLHTEPDNGVLKLYADSDSLITKGLIAVFIRLLSGLPPEEILKADMSKLDKTGLKDHLAPTRANALNSMAAQIKQAAMKMAEHH